MTMTGQTTALEKWLRDNGGFLHPSVHVVTSTESGVHWRAIDAVNGHIATVPHSLALSYLNALVDDAYPVFKQHKDKFKIEAIGFFYLMAQYLDAKSFWRPYLDILPKPEDGATTPLWFDAAEDIAWLENTDALHTSKKRRAIYERYYQDGIAVLAGAGVDTTLYTWDLFRWSITMFTSRAFSSRAISPQDSKYWTTYKSRSDGRRQTVLLDLSHVPAEDRDFRVLFPVIDAANHHHDAKVEWRFEPGRFVFKTVDTVQAGSEVLNNYGPKANAELLIGYGFCMENNPHDTVLLTLKEPSQDLQTDLKVVHAGYFTSGGDWNSDKATFGIKRTVSDPLSRMSIFSQLPEPLIGLLLYTLRCERDLEFQFVEAPLQYLTSGDGRRYLPHIARMIVESLVPKLSRLQSVKLPPEPSNDKQKQASIYREGQIAIIETVTNGLRTFLRSLRRGQSPGALLTLEEAMRIFANVNRVSCQNFLAGIRANANTDDVKQLRLAGWEEDVWVLLLSWLHLDQPRLEGFAARWTDAFSQAYADLSQSDDADEGERRHAEGSTETEISNLMDFVLTAARGTENTLWADCRWNERLLHEYGGRALRYESMMMDVRAEKSGEEEPRLVVYLHCG